VDVEGLYAPGLSRPEALPSGSSGYAHRTAREGLWGPTADRFAGAVLLAEMLGWGDETVREACYGETYFDPAEMPAQGGPNPPRYRTLISALARHYGQPVADLFERAWTSETLADCPTFGEWLVALPEHPVAQALSPSTPATEPTAGERTTSPQESASVDATAEIRAFMQAARRMEDKGNLEGALELYRQALELAGADPSLRSLAREIELTVQDVEKRVAAQASRPQPAVEIPAPPSVSPLSLGEGPELKEQPRRKPGWGFWLLWVLATTAGWAVGLVVGDAVGNAVLNAVGDAVGWAVVEAVAGAVVGAVSGVAQWLILRRQVRRAGWWILASTAGWAVGLTMGDAAGKAVGLAVTGAVAGAVIGVAQWLLLRRQVRRAGWWILASTAGWAVGDAVGLAVIGAVSGIITGAVLVWLLRQPRREDERKSQPE
jgi:hypothetical protein